VGLGVAVDSTGIYVTGGTSSADFPVKGAFQSKLNGKADAFVLKLNLAGDTLLYSTYLGGSDLDGATAIAVDAAGAAYVTGMTNSANFPTTRGAFQTTFGGSGGESNFVAGDAFALKLDPSGQLVYSTYLGGSSDESGFAIAVDAAGNAYIAGATFSTNFPTKQPQQAAYAGTGRSTFLNGAPATLS
jgi:hypothetical protein